MNLQPMHLHNNRTHNNRTMQLTMLNLMPNPIHLLNSAVWAAWAAWVEWVDSPTWCPAVVPLVWEEWVAWTQTRCNRWWTTLQSNRCFQTLSLWSLWSKTTQCFNRWHSRTLWWDRFLLTHKWWETSWHLKTCRLPSKWCRTLMLCRT